MKPQYSLSTSILLSCYAALTRTGLLERSLPRWCFHKLYFLYKRHVEDPFYGFCKRYGALLKHKTIIDVGANIGYTAMVFAKAVGEKGTVVAFEPEPKNYSALISGVNRSPFRHRIVPVQAALGERTAHASLWINHHHHADHRIATSAFEHSSSDTIQVDVLSLDAYLTAHPPLSPVALIKLDVQGFEPAVCRGMVDTVSQYPECWIAFEYCPSQIEDLGFSPRDLLSFFTDRGYTLYLIDVRGSVTSFNDLQLSQTISGKGYAMLLAAHPQGTLPL